MVEYEIEFETAASELDVVYWFEKYITHEHDDFKLRYVRDGLYSVTVDGVVDRDLILDNPDYQVLHSHASEDLVPA